MKRLVLVAGILWVGVAPCSWAQEPNSTTTHQDTVYMSAAFSEIAKYPDEGPPVGAVVVRSGDVIGSGHNRTESVTGLQQHAETEAIAQAMTSLANAQETLEEDTTIYTTLEPCYRCAQSIIAHGIDRIVVCHKKPESSWIRQRSLQEGDPRLDWLDTAECHELSNERHYINQDRTKRLIRQIAVRHLKEDQNRISQ